MPSITPSYLYTFIALMAVSTLLILSFKAYSDTLRSSLEMKQLKSMIDCSAAKSIELLTLTLTTNATSETSFSMPASIGHKQYWLRLGNDSSKAWIEGGLGDTPIEETGLRIYLLQEVSARGYYIGGYGAVLLKCCINSSTPHILLTHSGDGD